MSFINKLKASIGIGNAKVDTIIDKPTYTQGETVTGKVVINGGEVEQTFDGITLDFMTTVMVERDDNEYREGRGFMSHRISGETEIEAGKTIELPFSVDLPKETPPTDRYTDVWVRTRIDIPMAVDPKDMDPITVNPSPEYQSLLEAVSNLGFQARKVKNIPVHFSRLGIVRKYEFLPVSGPFAGHLDEFEMVILPERGGFNILVEIDRKAKGLGGLLAEMADVDESKASFFIDPSTVSAGPNAIEEQLRQTISRYI